MTEGGYRSNDDGYRPQRGGYSPRTNERTGEWRPLEVPVIDGNVDRAIKILKREMGKDGILKMLRLKRHYEKPSAAKKRKQREAVRRQRRTNRRSA